MAARLDSLARSALISNASAAVNNGGAFAGISADTPLLDYGLGAAMLLRRFAFLVPVLATAGSLAAKPKLPPSAGTFPTDVPLFIGLLIGVILILGGPQYLPALALEARLTRVVTGTQFRVA